MTETTQIAIEPTPTQPETLPTNPAVERCLQAYRQARKSALERGHSDYGADSIAERAYRRTMPPLSGAENIRDFIACIAHAMLIGAIQSADGARLLYAAQVANGSLERPAPRNIGRPPSNP